MWPEPLEEQAKCDVRNLIKFQAEMFEYSRNHSGEPLHPEFKAEHERLDQLSVSSFNKAQELKINLEKAALELKPYHDALEELTLQKREEYRRAVEESKIRDTNPTATIGANERAVIPANPMAHSQVGLTTGVEEKGKTLYEKLVVPFTCALIVGVSVATAVVLSNQM